MPSYSTRTSTRWTTKKRNSTWLRAILRSYARNISTEASQATIAADMGGEPPSENTVADYLDALRRTYVTEDLPAWNPALQLQDRRAHQPDAALLRSEHRGGPVGRVSAEALAGL